LPVPGNNIRKMRFPQLAIITFHSASLQAAIPREGHKDTLEMARSRTLRTKPPYEFYGNQRWEKGNDNSGNVRRPETVDIDCAFHNFIEYEPVTA
jgi:hypothetical protein